MQKYYQLNLERWLMDDWTGTVWRSKLYKSEKDCREGCAEDEIWNIAEAVWSFWDQESDPRPLSDTYNEFFTLRKDYEKAKQSEDVSNKDENDWLNDEEELIEEVDDFIDLLTLWILKGHSAGDYSASGISADFVEHEVAE